MKKSLLIITTIVMVIACLSLAACSNIAMQSVLELPWDKYSEKSTYEVVGPDDQGVLGTLTVTYKRYVGEDIDIAPIYVDNNIVKHNAIKPAYAEKNFHGLVVITNLALDDGQYKDSIVIVDKQSRAKYSYANQHFKNIDDNTKFDDIESQYDYTNINDKKAVTMKYDVKGNVVEKSGEVKLKPFDQIAYFDNTYYIAITRVLGPITAQRQLSFLTHSFREDKMLRRVAQASGRPVEIEPSKSENNTIDITKFELPKKPESENKDEAKPEEPAEPKTTITCVATQIASAETMPGSGAPILYYVSAFPYKYDDTHTADKLLVKFVEHGITYNLIKTELVAEI